MVGSLKFYWYETKPTEEAGTAWAQLAGASHRLHFVCEEIETCASDATTEGALERLEYHMEKYQSAFTSFGNEPWRWPLPSMVGERSPACLKRKRYRNGALQMLQERGSAFCQELQRCSLGWMQT